MKTITIKGVCFGEGRPKICVPIVGRTREEILSQAESMPEYPIDMVEWRADWYEDVTKIDQVEVLLKEINLRLKGIPLLVTFRTKGEGGDRFLEISAYEKLNCQIVSTGLVDFIDVELFSGEATVKRIINKAHSHGVRVILSNHDFLKTPEKAEIIQRLCLMQALDGDMLKIAVMPNSGKDVLTLMDAVLEMKEKWADRPLIAMSMTKRGVVSRLAGEFFGSAVTFGSLGQASAPGQVPVTALREGLDIFHESLREKSRKTNIYLIGFMGCGKSTVARALERKYHLTRLEMDNEIEKWKGMKIPDIFEKYGEEYFRNAESEYLKDVESSNHVVVSCGGGAVLRTENVEQMHKHGAVVLLTASPETILKRVKNDTHRPLLKGKKTVEDISSLMEKRREKYEAAADLKISTDGKTAEDIAAEIMNKLKERGM